MINPAHSCTGGSTCHDTHREHALATPTSSLRALLAVTVLGLAHAAGAAPAIDAVTEWPFPDDIPTASAANPGLAGSKPYDITRFLMTRGPRNASLSADGELLAFISARTGKPQLFTQRLGSGTPQQITFGRAVTNYQWLPDGKRLIYAADRDGNEREGYTLISATGQEEVALQQAGDAFRVLGGFSSDGEQVAFASTARNGVDYDVYVQQLDSAQPRQVFQGTFGFFPRAWQPGGALMLVDETRGEDGNNLYLLEASSGEIETLFKPEVSAEYQDFAWLRDGTGFYLAASHEREFRALAFYDLDQRALSWVDTPAHDVDNVTLFGGDRYLAWTVNEEGYDALAVLDRRTGGRLAAPTLPDGVYQLAGADAANRLLIRVNGPRTPGELWLWEPGKPAELLVSPTLAGLNAADLVLPSSLRFKARDGVELQGLLYEPTQPLEAGEQRPLMLRVHGGPSGQARPTFRPVIQYLVGRGYAVFDFNFRGSTGFGKTYARLDNGRLRPDAVRDIEDAVRWLTENQQVDGRRMAIMGGSYGGYLTNAAVGEYPGVFKAAVSFVGVSDWVRALEEASPALKASDRIEYGDINDPQDRAFFASISPIAKADRIRTPMVVVHGANDPRDPVTESDALVRRVREQEVEVKYLRFADEGHSLRKLGNRVTAYRTIADFLDEKLGQTEPQ